MKRKWISENELLNSDDSNIANIYLLDGDLRAVIDEDGRRVEPIDKKYRRTSQGMEMEMLFDRKLDVIGKKAFSYQHGNRYIYNGGPHVFACIEGDGSLGGMGYEFITKQHDAMDKRFWYWMRKFEDYINDFKPFINDDCGGHIHISGWEMNESRAVFGAFRAYEPMLIMKFGNGEDGIMRRNDYSSIYPIIKLNDYGRNNIHVKSSTHFELRFYDGETDIDAWFLREIYNDAIVHIGRSMGYEGIGRYISPKLWYEMYQIILDDNEFDMDMFNKAQKEFMENAKRTNYPYLDYLMEKKRLDDLVKGQKEHIIISLEV